MTLKTPSPFFSNCCYAHAFFNGVGLMTMPDMSFEKYEVKCKYCGKGCLPYEGEEDLYAMYEKFVKKHFKAGEWYELGEYVGIMDKGGLTNHAIFRTSSNMVNHVHITDQDQLIYLLKDTSHRKNPARGIHQ